MKSFLLLLVLLVAPCSAQLVSLQSDTPDVREKTMEALASFSFNCRGYLGLYGDKSIRNADHFVTIKKTSDGFLYHLEGHGIQPLTRTVPDKPELVTLLLNHNAIFNLTKWFHLEPSD